MDDRTISRGYKKAWMLVGISFVFVIGFFFFTLYFNGPNRRITWDMGGTPFVPASSLKAEGYYQPVPKQALSPKRDHTGVKP